MISPAFARARAAMPLDVLVVATVAAVLTLAAAPALARARAKSNRSKCSLNLRMLGIAAIAYMTSGLGPGGSKGSMPHVGAVNVADGPGDVGRAFELMIRVGEIDDPEILVCPSSNAIPRRLMSWQKEGPSFAFKDPDVTTSSELSYGWTSLAKTDASSRSSDLIAADRCGGYDVSKPAPPQVNHPDGRNVLRFDASVDFVPSDVEKGPTADPKLVAALASLNLGP